MTRTDICTCAVADALPRFASAEPLEDGAGEVLLHYLPTPVESLSWLTDGNPCYCSMMAGQGMPHYVYGKARNGSYVSPSHGGDDGRVAGIGGCGSGVVLGGALIVAAMGDVTCMPGSQNMIVCLCLCVYAVSQVSYEFMGMVDAGKLSKWGVTREDVEYDIAWHQEFARIRLEDGV